MSPAPGNMHHTSEWILELLVVLAFLALTIKSLDSWRQTSIKGVGFLATGFALLSVFFLLSAITSSEFFDVIPMRDLHIITAVIAAISAVFFSLSLKRE